MDSILYFVPEEIVNADVALGGGAEKRCIRWASQAAATTLSGAGVGAFGSEIGLLEGVS